MAPSSASPAHRVARPLVALVVLLVAVVALGAPGGAQTDGGEPPSTEVPATEPPVTEPPVTEAPVTDPGASDLVDASEPTGGQGGDVLVLLLVGIGGLLVIGLIVRAIGLAQARRSDWRRRGLGAYREATWVHDTLVPGRFGAGLEARSLVTDARRRVTDFGADLAALELQAPSQPAKEALIDVRNGCQALLAAFESDVSVRATALGGTRADELATTADTVKRRRAELDDAIQRLHATL